MYTGFTDVGKTDLALYIGALGMLIALKLSAAVALAFPLGAFLGHATHGSGSSQALRGTNRELDASRAQFSARPRG